VDHDDEVVAVGGEMLGDLALVDLPCELPTGFLLILISSSARKDLCSRLSCFRKDEVSNERSCCDSRGVSGRGGCSFEVNARRLKVADDFIVITCLAQKVASGSTPPIRYCLDPQSVVYMDNFTLSLIDLHSVPLHSPVTYVR